MNANKHYADGYNAGDDDFVDINAAASYKENKNGKHASSSGSGGSGKKLAIIISSVTAVVIIAVCVVGFCYFGDENTLQTSAKAVQPTATEEYTYPKGLTVSGVSIGGKTYEEAKEALEADTSSFIKPIKISIDVNGSTDSVDQDDFEYTYNIEDVLTLIKNTVSATEATQSTTKSYEVTATVTSESIESVAQTVAKRNYKAAVNARVSEFTPYADERFEYEDAQSGQEVDADDLVRQINTAFSSGESSCTITAQVTVTEADISVDDVKNNIVKLATYSTVSTNTANGTENMRVSLAACNGSVIESGDTWSFNECTGNSNLESLGYKAATVISDGEYTSGIGGGICQSSSTIYNAALRANLEVVERSEHMWASSYVPTGLDATIDYGNLDLKLKNNSDYQVFLECKVDGTTLYATFWGYKSDSYDYITTENEFLEQSDDDYTVQAWRVYYKDGEKVKTEDLGKSSYDIQHGVTFISAENDSGVLYDGSDDS